MENINKLINDFYFNELKAAILCKVYSENLNVFNLPNTASVLQELSMDKFDIHLGRISEFLERFGNHIQFTEISFSKINLDNLDSKQAAISIFEEVLSNEQDTRQKALEIANLSMQSGYHDAYEFIQWFVKDSMEDINELSSVLENLKIASSVLQVESLLKK